MRMIISLLLLGIIGACGAEPEAPGVSHDTPVSAEEQPVFSYYPMGFARVSAAGAVVSRFNSTGGAVSISHSTGSYTVTFAGLGVAVNADSVGGHIQISAEGTSNVRCQSGGWSGSPNLSVTVRCNAPNGTLTDSAFTVLFFRYTMPAPSSSATWAAYSLVSASGSVSPYYDFNSSGTHNTVTKSGTGTYQVTISHATSVNASMMVTSHGKTVDNMCSISSWGSGYARIECRNLSGTLADSAFAFSYSLSGPATSQQSAHAWFDGTSANPTFSAALSMSECTSASVSGSRSGSLASIIVSGELRPWDADPFVRASLVSHYGSGGGYCKVESLSSVEGSPSTATTTVRCYTAIGTVNAAPQFTFTHVTSDGWGPC